MFRGSYSARVDEKGRLKIPADFKREIDERYGSNIFYVTSTNGRSAEIFPLKEWEKIEDDAAKKPSNNPILKRFLGHTSYWGQVVEMDAQGRVLLPSLLREKAGLNGEVAVAGALRNLSVRNGAALAKEIEEHPLTDEELSELGI